MPEVDGLFLLRLNDPHAVENGVALAGATAALTLIEPRRLSVSGRLAYRAALGAITGWAAWTAVRTEHEYLMPTTSKIGVTAGAVGVALALCEAGEALDARIHDALARGAECAGRASPWRVQPPRSAWGVGGWLAEWTTSSRTLSPTTIWTPLAPSLSRMRCGRSSPPSSIPEGFGAPELRTQLAPSASLYVGEREDDFYPGIGFEVPEVSRAVPATATFP